jgi:hypothetical protein
MFILGIVVAVAGAGYAMYDRYGRGLATGVVAIVVGLFCAYASTWTTVDARSVGVKTSFNKESGTLGPGFSHKAPWEDVEEWTTRNQVMRFAASGGEERDNYRAEPFVTVRIAGQAEAYVDLTVTFGVTEKSVTGLWAQHKTFDAAMRDFAVPQVTAAAGEVFDGHDPLARIRDPQSGNKDVGLDEWTRRLTAKLAPMYAARSVELVEARVTYVRYDKPTTDKLNALNTEIANTALAAQKVETAKKDAEASAARRAQGGSDCASLMRDLAAVDQIKNLPPGFNCGGTTTGLVVQPR